MLILKWNSSTDFPNYESFVANSFLGYLNHIWGNLNRILFGWLNIIKTQYKYVRNRSFSFETRRLISLFENKIHKNFFTAFSLWYLHITIQHSKILYLRKWKSFFYSRTFNSLFLSSISRWRKNSIN